MVVLPAGTIPAYDTHSNSFVGVFDDSLLSSVPLVSPSVPLLSSPLSIPPSSFPSFLLFRHKHVEAATFATPSPITYNTNSQSVVHFELSVTNMCPLLRSSWIFAVSFFAGTLSPCDVSAFRPPAFSAGRMVATRPKATTVAAYADHADAEEERFSVLQEKLKESELKLQDSEAKLKEADSKLINYKLDVIDKKIDTVAKDLKDVAKDLGTIKLGLLAIICLGFTQWLPGILTVLK